MNAHYFYFLAFQINAMCNALKCNCSFIHGPPGTGKTFTLSEIAVTLYLLEKGKFFASAPSNVACDGICQAIAGNGKFHPKVLRIYAKRRELAILDGGKTFSPLFFDVAKQKLTFLTLYIILTLLYISGHGLDRQEAGFDKLHEKVRESANWINTQELRRIHGGKKNIIIIFSRKRNVFKMCQALIKIGR